MRENKSNSETNSNSFFLNTYKRIPLNISKGRGVYLFTKDGTKYLDFFSGLGVNALGYSHPLLIKAIENQMKKYAHLSNLFIAEPQTELAERLINISSMKKVFFTNSGTEAVEAAIKIIRKKYGSSKKIISFTGSFHGRTYGSLSLTANINYRKNFLPLLPQTEIISFNNIKALEKKISNKTAAVFIEFLQGEGGINPAAKNFITTLKSLRKKYGFAIVADEVQSGLGRTGKPFAFDHFKIKPDLIVVAKALGGGLPLGAVIVNNKLERVFKPGEHGSTFGGNPVACAAGNIVLKEVFEKGLVTSVNELGNYFISELLKIKDKYPGKINEVRGAGFMIGIELMRKCNNVVNELLKRKIIVNCTANNVLRILPPLIAEKKHINIFLTKFSEVIKAAK